jgi:hypothetical protein
MKYRILIITQQQFGSQIDYYQYSLFLKEKHEIEYICWDYNKSKIEIDGISVKYISRKGNLIKRNLRFLKAVLMLIDLKNHDKILVNYFRGCFLLPLLFSNKNNIFLDIRTASVSKYIINRLLYDKTLLFESLFYKNISVISLGVKKRLMLKKNANIIPLGSNYINVNRKFRNGLYLLYIGTFINRNIEQTIKGVYLFLNANKNININYTIIGTGDDKTNDLIKNTIKKYNLSGKIKLLGYIPYGELTRYYEESNVGVSFVPITKYYDFQPVTKTFDYLMSGLPVIATSTFENKLIINNSNGILINDNPKSFCSGLSKIYHKLNTYDENSIKQELNGYQWRNIAQKMENQLLNF